jgi:hypothetical protein
MFKTIVIAALGFAAVSAQFLDERNLQNGTTTTTAAPVAFAAACAVSATGVESGCNTAGYCCAANTRTGTAVAATVPVNLCVPTDFIGQNLTIAGSIYSFSKCLANVTATAPVRTACAANDGCTVGQCCTDVALTAGLATANGTATRKFCTAGTASTLFSSTYVAASWAASYAASVRSTACTPNVAPVVTSFGSYIKASVMMVVAVLSVALF